MALFFTPSVTALIGRAVRWPGNADSRRATVPRRRPTPLGGEHAGWADASVTRGNRRGRGPRSPAWQLSPCTAQARGGASGLKGGHSSQVEVHLRSIMTGTCSAVSPGISKWFTRFSKTSPIAERINNASPIMISHPP